jgi:FG-GAP-like repeat
MRVLLGLAALVLLTAAKPRTPVAPPPPPAVGVKAANLAGGARRIDAVLPARLVAAAYPRGTDGKHRIVALLDNHELYLIETGLIETGGSGSQRRLLADLPEKAVTLLAADLDGDGADEILLGEAGTLWTLGTPEAPAPPRKVLDEVDARNLLGIQEIGAAEIAAAEVGRLRTWKREGGKLVPGAAFELPVRARRQGNAIRLETPDVERMPQGTGASSSQSPLYLVGPEANGKTRLLTLLLTRGEDGAEQRTEAWSRFAGPEQVNEHRFVRIDGRPLLLVTTTNAEKVSIFEKKKLRLFPFAADRTRAGQVSILSSPTEAPRWFPVEPTVVDLDRDGREDLVIAQQEGLRGKSLRVEVFFGKGQGQGRFELPSRKTEIDLQARAWHYGADVTGDGRPDLIAIQQQKLSVFAGSSDPRRAPLESRPRLTLDLPATEGIAISTSAGDGGVSVDKEGADPLQVIDLDGDGRGEIVHILRDDQGRGRVTVVSSAHG